MQKLRIKPTLEATAVLLGFFAVFTAISFLFDLSTGNAVRILLYEWGAFPMLCAIVGGVVSEKSGFLPFYGLLSGIVFIPFMYLFYDEQNYYVVLMYVIFGYIGTLFGYFLYRKEVRRIESGSPKEKRKSILLMLFDRHHIDKYK